MLRPIAIPKLKDVDQPDANAVLAAMSRLGGCAPAGQRLVTESRIGRRRSVIALALIAAGGEVIALALNPAAGNLIGAIAGSVLLAVGMVLATPSFLPPALRLLGRGAGAVGVTGRLAATNTVRNPGRATATCTALMPGVGLIVTLQVGAASVENSVNATLTPNFRSI